MIREILLTQIGGCTVLKPGQSGLELVPPTPLTAVN